MSEEVLNETPETNDVALQFLISHLNTVFNVEKSTEFIDTLNDAQRQFLFVFVSGFQAGIGRNIVGVFSEEYISKNSFTEEVLAQVSLKMKHITVKDIELSFVLVWQYF